MKKLVLILILSMSASAQPSLTASHIRFGTTLPSTCNPSTGDVFFKTTATIGQYQCLTTNTWTAVPTTSGGATPGAPDNSLQYRVNSTTLGGSSNLLFNPTALATPTAPTVSVVGTPGTSTYGYRVDACNAYGCTPGSTEADVTTGNATLDSTNKNRIITAAVTGSTSCNVFRVADDSMGDI